MLAPAVLAACVDAQDAPLSVDPARAGLALEQTCTSLRGTAVDVQDDSKVLHARLEGDLTGTLQIIEHSQFDVGVVERSSAFYTVDVEPGAVLFGDGMAGRVPPAGGINGTSYRYGAQGKIDGGTGAYSHVNGNWEVDGWIGEATSATHLDYRLVLCMP